MLNPEMTQEVDQLLEGYVKRLQVRPGNGLSKAMNGSLRTYPMIPDLLRAAVALLMRMEYLTGGEETIRFRIPTLFDLLADTEDGWLIEIPVMNQRQLRIGEEAADDGDRVAGSLRFEKMVNRAKTSLPAFVSAITIGRRIGLLSKANGVALSPEARKQLCLIG